MCPNAKCGRKLRVPDGAAGKRIRCPACNTSFTPAVEAPPSEEEEVPRRPGKRRPGKKEEVSSEPTAPPPKDQEEEPEEQEQEQEQEKKRKRKRRRKRKKVADDKDSLYNQAGWRKVSRGFLLCIVAMWLWIGEMALGVVGILAIGGIGFGIFSSMGVGSGEEGTGDADTAIATLAGLGAGLVLLFVAVNVLAFASSIMNLVGQFFCAFVPSEEGNLQTVAILPFALSVTATLITWVWQIIGLITTGFNGSIWTALPMSGGGGWVGLIVDIMEIVAAICWFRLLRGIALEAHDEPLSHQIGLYLVSCMGLAFGSCLFIPCSILAIVRLIPTEAGPGVLVVFGIFLLLLAGLVAWYLILLYKVRGAVLKLLRRAERVGHRAG
jgi:hypothetical protein